MTIRIIDLLNKKANGEELPKFIKYQSEIWMYANWDGDYQSEDDGAYLFKEYQPLEMLNDEIEVVEPKAKIIEEDKKIEKLDYHTDLNDDIVLDPYEYRTYPSFGIDPLSDNEEVLLRKINEIIEVINNDKSK